MFYKSIVLSKIMFKLEAKEGKARAGELKTRHGKIKTPFFMPVATKGAIKHLSTKQLEETGTNCFIANALLLSLKPGLEIIKKHGTLHDFMHWKKVIFTDSGGFQILIPGIFIKQDDRGVWFKDPYKGEKLFLTPEECMQIEMTIGADVAMCLDDVPQVNCDAEREKDATRRTHLWAEICKKAHTDKKQLLFGIAQGGRNPELRRKSMEHVVSLDFDGYAFGGLCLGEGREVMLKMVEVQEPVIPENKPRYLMGVGSPEDILMCIERGVDIFDSIYPTENARHETIFTRNGRTRITKPIYADDLSSLDENCDCYCCKHFTKSYVHHLMRIGEALGMQLSSIHNIHFLQTIMKEAREAILEGRFQEYKNSFLEKYKNQGNGI